MPFPKTTHQQFLVLHILKDGPLWGRDIRTAMKPEGYDSTNASFYEMMARMEQAELVEGEYAERDAVSQNFKERRYQITDKGVQAKDFVIEFYARRAKKRGSH